MSVHITELHTEHLAPDEEVSAWEEFNRHHMVALRCHTIGPRLRGHHRSAKGRDVSAVRISAEAHTIHRLDDSPTGHVQVSTVVGGDVYLHDCSGMHRLTEGQVLIFDTDQRYSIAFSSSATMTALLLPRTRKLEHALIFPTPAVVRETQEAVLRGHEAQVNVAALEDALFPTRSDLFREALDALSALRTRANLRLVGLAAELHVSPRHLSRIFSAHGTTFRAEITRLRLDGVVEDLRDPTLTRVGLAEIFHRNGFAHPSHGHRKFVDRFGITPGSMRVTSESARQ